MLRLRPYFLLAVIFLICVGLLATRRAESISSLRRITNTPEQSLNLNPSLSDDGRIVVFESSADLSGTGGNRSFHAMRADLSGEAPAFEEIGGTRIISPALSTDGKMIAFASTEDLVGENPDRNSEIFLFDGSGLKQLTHTEPDAGATRVSDGNLQPSLTADGRTIAFTSNRNLTGENPDLSYEIFLCDTLAQTYTQLTNNSDGHNAVNPKISAGGSRLYFRRMTTARPESGDLMLIDRETATTRVLAADIPDLAFTEGRAISNDGRRLVYSSSTAPNQSQVFIFDARDNSIRQVTQLGSRSIDVKLQPTISGDGKRVSFATRRRVTNTSDGSVELYLLDLPSGQVTQITNAPAAATAEVVSSLSFDGSLVAFNFPRLLSGPAGDENLRNNSEIYLMSIADRPAFGVATVLNAAAKGNEPGSVTNVAPGSIATIRGSALAFRAEAATFTGESPPLMVAGTTVRVNGQPARVFYAAPDEVVFIVPGNIPNGPADFVVTNADGFSSKAEAIVSASAPGIFTVGGDGRGEGIVLDADTLWPAPFDPSNGRLRLSIFATGMGRATNVSVTINGQVVTVETVAPANLSGLDEIHVLLPTDLRGAGQSVLSIAADGIQSNPVSVVIGGSPMRDIMINEFLADPPDGLAGDANHDGVRDSSADEFVELVNSTTRDLDLSGYQLQTRSLSGATDIVRHRFAANTILAAGTSIVVFGGGSPQADNPIFGGSQVVKATTGQLSLVNSGGVITVRDASGAMLTSVTYGSALGLPGDQNQSLTRSPDVTGNFSLHTAAPGSDGRSYSAGTRLSGDRFLPEPAISLITLAPAFQEILSGEEVKFTARAFDVDNRELTGVIFGWSSSLSSVLRIDVNGLVKAVAPGKASVTATARGVASEPALVIVTAPPTPTPTPTVTPAPQPSPSPSPSVVPSPSPVASPSPSPSPTPPTATAPVVISEFRTRGPNGASDEFVELYNNSDVPVDIGGWKIRGSSNNGAVATRLTISAGASIPGRGHFLATNSSGYSGAVAGDQSYTSGLANDGGLALAMPDDTIVDQVGLSPGSAFREGVHLVPLASDANQSYERRPGGAIGSTQDTDDNLADFQLLTPSDPQNTSSSPAPGPSPLPSPAPSPTATPSPAPTPIPSPSPLPSPSASPSPSPSGDRILISQVYGGGGNAGAPYRNDFIEIFNGGQSAVSLAGWSVQYASATASTWLVTTLTPVVLSPGQYYLIQEASGGSNGATLPAPDAAGVIAMAAGSGKVALVKNSAALTGSCPSDPNIVDMAGYGNTANCFKGAGPTAAPGNTTSALRAANGCQDTGSNAGDFTVATPNPRNTASPANLCASALFQVCPSLRIKAVGYLWRMCGRNVYDGDTEDAEVPRRARLQPQTHEGSNKPLTRASFSWLCVLVI